MSITSLLPRNGYILSEFFSLSYTTEALLSSKQNLLTGLKNWESPYNRERFTHPGPRVRTQNQHIASYWSNLLNDAGNNRSSIAPMFSFVRNTCLNYITNKTPYEIVDGTKPQNPMSSKLGLHRN